MWHSFKQMRAECVDEIIGDEAIEEMSFDPYDCEKMNKMKSDMICVSECIARKANFIDDEGAMNKTAVLAAVKASVKNTEWKLAAAEEIVNKCFTETKDVEESDECNALPMKISYCIWGEFTKSCPEELQINSKKCQKIREHIDLDDDKALFRNAYFHHLHYLKKMKLQLRKNED